MLNAEHIENMFQESYLFGKYLSNTSCVSCTIIVVEDVIVNKWHTALASTELSLVWRIKIIMMIKFLKDYNNINRAF